MEKKSSPLMPLFPEQRRKNPSADKPFSRRLGWKAGVKGVELYARVRRAAVVEGKSRRAVAREFGIDPRTVEKMVRDPEPPDYWRTKPPNRPKLDGVTEIPSGSWDQMLDDNRSMPRKRRHTAKWVFDRLHDERGYEGGYTNPPYA